MHQLQNFLDYDGDHSQENFQCTGLHSTKKCNKYDDNKKKCNKYYTERSNKKGGGFFPCVYSKVTTHNTGSSASGTEGHCSLDQSNQCSDIN